MGNIASAETVLKNAVKRTYGTVRKKPQKAKTFKAWTVSKLLETYKDPRAILLEIAGKDTKALAAEMQCSLIDALAERRLAAMCVLPYVAQKLPAQVDMRLTRAINLNIVDDRQYKELVEIAAEQADDADTFSMQLLTAQTVDETPANPTQQAPQPQQRPIQWDIQPGNKGAQRKNVTSLEPVTPPAPAPSQEGE